MKNIYGLTIEELEKVFIDLGSKKFHADQMFSWLYEKDIDSYDEVTNIKEVVNSLNYIKNSEEIAKIIKTKKEEKDDD